MRDEEDYLLLSQLTHAGYCLRRAGLVMNEQIWHESTDTIKGRMEHERVHMQRVEHRKNEVKIYEHEVVSNTLKIRGKCDCIEAVFYEDGCRVPGMDFPVRLYPIEYKHGKVRSEEEYELQLCAQAMCLEEMYDTHIPEGAIFYTSSHRRYAVPLTEELRGQVQKLISKVWEIREKMIIPLAEYSSKCIRCSLNEMCMPMTQTSASSYCQKMKEEAKKEVEEK